jgi:hypothetical protein
MGLMQKLIARIIGTEGIEEAAENPEAVLQLYDVAESREFAIDAGATTNLANTKIWSSPIDFDLRAVKAEINTGSAITADATNFAVYDLLVDDGAGGTPAVFATLNTSATNTAAGIDTELVLTRANCLVKAGSNVYRRVVKNGAGGLQVPAHAVKFRLRQE